MWGILYLKPFTKARQERLFFLTEISFGWECVEIFMISSIFAVLQIPDFGNSIIQDQCDNCFTVGVEILPQFSVSAIAAVVHVTVNVWLYVKAHRVLYPRVWVFASKVNRRDGRCCKIRFDDSNFNWFSMVLVKCSLLIVRANFLFLFGGIALFFLLCQELVQNDATVRDMVQNDAMITKSRHHSSLPTNRRNSKTSNGQKSKQAWLGD